jgi:hypothetical protein
MLQIKWLLLALHGKKRFSIFLSPAGMSLNKLSRGGIYDVTYKLFLPTESLVSGAVITGSGYELETLLTPSL